jgi:hypothetical protein
LQIKDATPWFVTVELDEIMIEPAGRSEVSMLEAKARIPLVNTVRAASPPHRV